MSNTTFWHNYRLLRSRMLGMSRRDRAELRHTLRRWPFIDQEE